MATEKDIRKFMKDNAPAMRDGGHFMEDIVRQIELLPVPASWEFLRFVRLLPFPVRLLL